MTKGHIIFFVIRRVAGVGLFSNYVEAGFPYS
jgi:hypothetical protein